MRSRSYFWPENVARVPVLLNLMPLDRARWGQQTANLDAASQSAQAPTQYISDSDTFKTVDVWELKRC
jgi:hypothetical protein